MTTDLNHNMLAKLCSTESNDLKEDEECEIKENVVKFKYDVNELLNQPLDNKIIEDYEKYMASKFGNEKPIYYTYSNLLVDTDTNELILNSRFYDGKGRGERILTAFRVAYACIALNINPINFRTEYIYNQLKTPDPVNRMAVVKTNLNLINKDSLVRETSMFDVSTDAKVSNISKSSINLDQLKIPNKEETIKQLNIKSIQNLIKEEPLVMSLEYLKKDYESNFKYIFSKFNQSQLNEEVILNVIDLESLKQPSSLNSKQKLISTLEHLNGGNSLSSIGLNRLFKINGEEECLEKSIDFSYQNIVKRLMYSRSSNEELLNMINELKEEDDEEEFIDLIGKLVEETRSLLMDKENKRLTIEYYSTNELYVINKIVNFSKENDQFLNIDSTFQIYLNSFNIKSNESAHSIVGVYTRTYRIRSGELKYLFTNMDNNIRNYYDNLVESKYNELVKDKKNHLEVQSSYTPEQYYALNSIVLLVENRKVNLTYDDYFRVYTNSKVNEIKKLNRKTVSNYIKQFKLSTTKLNKLDLTEKRKLEIDNLIKEKYLEYANDNERKKKIEGENFSKESKYIVFKLIDNDIPPEYSEILRIASLCKPTGREITKETIQRKQFYDKYPLIDNERKIEFDTIINREYENSKNIPKWLEYRRDVINDRIEKEIEKSKRSELIS